MVRLSGISLVSIPFASSPASAQPNFSLEMIAKCHKKVIQVFSDALGENETVEQYRKAIHFGFDRETVSKAAEPPNGGGII